MTTIDEVLQSTNVTSTWSDTVTALNVSVPAAASDNCFITFSSDGLGDIISPETEFLISKLKSAVFFPLIYAFGGPTNLFDIIVFFRQGFKDRVSLCLFTLAVTNFTAGSFLFLIFADQMFVFNSPDTYGPVFAFFANNKILLFYSTFYSSMFLSAIIALERCFCVLLPLRAKTLLSTGNMAVIIFTGVPIVSFLRLVVMAKYEVACFYDRRRQLTYRALHVTDYQGRNKELLEVVDAIFYGFVISVGSPVIVLIATVIMSVKLWQTAAWRKLSLSTNSRREIAVTKMLVMLSAQFVLFTLPVVFLRIYPLFNADFSPVGRYRLFFLAFTNISEAFGLLAMSFNFVVYYLGSSRYREIFYALFKPTCCSKTSVPRRGISARAMPVHRKSYQREQQCCN